MEIGRRTIHEVIDRNAAEEPTGVLIKYPQSSSFDAWTSISHKTFKNAVDRMAWWLADVLGSHGSQVICYVGGFDIRYYLLTVAASKTSFKALFSSPRNSMEAHVSLMEATGCRVLSGDPKRIPVHLFPKSISFVEMPPLEHWLDLSDAPQYPFNKTFDEVADETVVFIHTSGSTGLPKALPIKHSTFAVVDSYQQLPSLPGRRALIQTWGKRGARLFSALPPFHGAGVDIFASMVFNGTTLIQPPPGQPPSLGVLESMLDSGEADCGLTAASTLVEVSQTPRILEKLKRWTGVGYGGSPLSKPAGDAISKYTLVCNELGTTETHFVPSLQPLDRSDWHFNEFHPSLGVKFREREDGLGEVVVVRDPLNARFQAVFCTFPELDEYKVPDLYERHPVKPSLWKHIGRSDDVLVFSNGEKIVPNQMEHDISQHPDVSAAVVTGNGKFFPVLLVEAGGDSLTNVPEHEKVERIWPTVTTANGHMPSHGKIAKSHIRFLKPGQKFPRTSKGQISRKTCVKEFHDVIEEVYSASNDSAGELNLDFSNRATLEASLLTNLRSLTETMSGISAESDIFAHGTDSLQVLRLARAIRKTLATQSNGEQVDFEPRVIYSNPSASRLTTAILDVLGTKPGMIQNGHQQEPHADTQKLFEKYAITMPLPSEAPIGVRIILTGSTGSLGNYLLDSVLRQERVEKVYCLNRTSDAEQRHVDSCKRRGLNAVFEPSRVEFLQADLASPNFGLTQDTYDRLRTEATHIIHNAWNVNFNHALESFEPQVRGCANLVTFSINSRWRSQVFFVSSIGAVKRWPAGSPVPEQAIFNLNVCDDVGYSKSKLISEMLLANASQTANVSSTICRVGQIAGPVLSPQGEWNKHEWLPSVIASSSFLGKLPTSIHGMDRIDWVPVDILGQVLVELVLSPAKRSETAFKGHVEVLHAVNPTPATWSEILPEVSRLFPHAQVVEYEEWLAALENSAKETTDTRANPAVKLLDFFRSIRDSPSLEFETSQACNRSRMLSDMPKVNQEWMAMWMKQWGY
ncbi:acetyl-CoA synthetase-like protein [Rhizodiscina lignyota]|uniref:Acetyl-CoA synthetase-like protein n=1 Tax=Rhizodiscina lignyota TaxID=1504668 RepID=A0A9P4MAR6_9PEZI|nr:acetyl-CoA synthetase-like protein [Rhizodiscina lignyota]